MEKSTPEELRSPYTVGIDFGTTNSVIAVYKKGKPEIIEIEGSRLTPSVVYFREGDEPLIGEQAKRSAVIYPEKTITSIKMKLSDSDWKFSYEGMEYTPTDVSSMILGKLKEGAQRQEKVKLEGTIRKAVICVPANFDNNKREEVIKAAKTAGFEEIKIIEEPVAAAIAYAMHREADTTILVYDLGGGTFDVCILHVLASKDADIKNKFEILSKQGIPDLGGDDFDNIIMEKLRDYLLAASNIDILDTSKEQPVSRKKLREAKQIIKQLSEQAKITLSEAPDVIVEYPQVIKDESGKIHGIMDFKITREQFKEWTQELIIQTKKAVEKALDEAKISIDDIDRIILVGGSTNMPMVKEMVLEMFGKEPYADIEPTTVVAEGAALYSQGIVEVNKTSHFLGVELHNRKFGEIISKGMNLPATGSKKYETVETDPEAVQISVFQSHNKAHYVTDDGVVFMGEFFLKIPDEVRKETVREVNVIMDVDQEQIVKVSAELIDKEGVKKEVVVGKM